ncbi:tetratricopeptide repeat protein [Bdellovibrio sp. SKB1291214]|uniref:tetratricopeptide repeat protein n=1 Tax=Bdellovibrio sp. SKB1291214 TaxID=1732569 RepID=UPI000B51D6C2|nr:tetratricopeptide repeat protein [Bdellovibrio sp. SKB1291214]UYL09331.1 tetratricopeptide repeat protein [Bdellovibrio sp. SKB1291214]
MLRSFKTTASVTLLLSLAACGSIQTKENTTPREIQSLLIPSSPHDPANVRAQADYQFIVGDVLSREGKSNKAIEHFKKVAALDPASAAVDLRLSNEYQKLGKTKEAILSAENAVAKESKNLEAHSALGRLYSKDGAYDQAIAQYNVILGLQPDNSEAPIYIGSLYAAKRDFKKAEQQFNSLLKNPKFASPHTVYYYLGVMRLDQKASQYEIAAEKEFKKSLQAKPDFEDAAVALMNLYSEQRNSSKALALGLEYQKHDAFSAKISDAIVQIYIDNGDLEKAYTQLEFTANSSAPTVEGEIKMSLILIKLKKFDQATAKLNDILARAPTADTARYYLAAIHEESGNTEKAIQAYLQIPSSSEHFTESMAHAAYLLKSQGKINKALAITSKGMKVKADPQLFIMHASLLDSKSDIAGAARVLETGLTKYSQNTELRFQHAIMLDRLGKKDDMLTQMRKVLEINPDHVQSLSYLAFSLAERNQQLPEAESLARHASQLAPEDGYVLDTFGWVLFKQKKYSESIKVLEKAHQYQPTASIIAEHLADAYSMQSQTEKAKDLYKKAAALTTDETQASKIRSKLQGLRS